MNWHPNKQLSVLHVALVAPGYSNEGIMKGLLSGGFSVYRCFDYQEKMFSHDKDTMRRMLIREVEQFKPDIVFCQIQSSEILDDDTFIRLGRLAFTVNYTFDIRSKEQTDWMYRIGPYIGLTCFSNQNDVDEYARKGYDNAMCLHSSADVEVYKPADEYIERDGLVFIGNNFLNTLMPFPKSQHRVEMVQELKKEFGTYFEVYGIGWFGPMATTVEEVGIYQEAFMAINQTNYDASSYTSDRIWRILATGCLCLTEYFDGIETMFTNHEELIWWRTIDELKSLIHHYMANSKRAQQIGMNGMSAMLTRHTWKNRIEGMMTFIQNNLMDMRVWSIPIPGGTRYQIDQCTKAGVHVIGGVIPGMGGEEDAKYNDVPCDCKKLRGLWAQCECGNKQFQFRWTENI